MIKNERGAVVVEASIAFSTFIFTIFVLYSLVNICLAQAKINVAVNCAAKEISQYSYLYSLTDIPGIHADIAEKGELANGSVSNVVDGIEAMYNAIGNVPDTGVEEAYNTGKAAYEQMKSGVDTALDDPKAFILSMAYSLGDSAIAEVMNELCERLAQVLVKKNLVSEKGGSVEAYLKNMGVVKGEKGYFDGISFEGTEFFPDGNENPVIKIVASFDVSVMRLLNTDIKFHICVCGHTKPWSVS